MALHISVCAAVPAKATAAWVVAYICSGWTSLVAVGWTGQHPRLSKDAMHCPPTVMDVGYQGDVNNACERPPPVWDQGCWYPAVQETTRMQLNSGDEMDYELRLRGCGVLPSPDDPGVPPEARREQYHESDLLCTILRLPAENLEQDASGFMQTTAQETGWFTKAKKGFARLLSQGDGRRAALTLRDRLRRCRHHAAIQAHLPDILAAEPQEEEVRSGVRVEVEVWVQFVLEELARVGGLSGADREVLTGADEGQAIGSTPTCPSPNTESMPHGIFHAAYIWSDGSWSTREDLRQTGRFDLLPQSRETTEDDDTGGGLGSMALESELDGVSMFQLGARDTTWEDLMEQMWTWFEGGLQVELALAMLRRRTEERRDRDYLRWVQGPLHTVGAGVALCRRASTETTPPIFYRWSQRVEAHLFAGYFREIMDTGDESSMMDREGYDRRRARARSRTTRGERWQRRAERRERVTEETRHLGGGRASGSRPDRLPADAWEEWSYRRSRNEEIRGCSARDAVPRRATGGTRGTGAREGHEQASGSGDPAPIHGDMVPVVNEASGIPNLQEPMLVSQAVDLWRYLLFARDTYTNPRGAVPLSWLPMPMLRDIQVHLESMSQHNLAVMTVGLMSMLRFLMAELSQTMDFAQAILNSQTNPDEAVDLDEDDPEPDGLGDGTSLMQGFFSTDGRDSMDRRWARAMLRLHKELDAQSKPMRLQSVAVLRGCMPAVMLSLSATSWQSQLQAVLVAVQDDSQGAEGAVEAPHEWIQSWVQELSEFIPGFHYRQQAQLVDSVSDRAIEELIQDEAEERAVQQALEARDEEEEARREAHDLLCAQEMDHLQKEAAEYHDWERHVERSSLKRAPSPGKDEKSKKVCHMTMEIASGSSDRPRVLHTLAFDIPADGTDLTLRFRTHVDTEPSEVSTVVVPQPAMEASAESVSAAQGEGNGPTPAGQSVESLQVCQDSMPNLLSLMEFEEYSLLFDRWRRGELSQQEVQKQHGTEVMELMLAQEAIQEQADEEGLQDPIPSLLVPDTVKGNGMFRNEEGVLERYKFGRFEVIYGQWRDGYRSSEQVQICYGDTWLALFRMWRTWGLDAVWPYLHRVLDVLEDCVVTNVVGKTYLEPEHLAEPLKIPWSAVKVYYKLWRQGDMDDAHVVTRFGEVWLVLFQKIRSSGLERARPDLSLYVDWDVDGGGSWLTPEIRETVPDEQGDSSKEGEQST